MRWPFGFAHRVPASIGADEGTPPRFPTTRVALDAAHPLVLVIAPPGWGKTMLVVQYLDRLLSETRGHFAVLTRGGGRGSDGGRLGGVAERQLRRLIEARGPARVVEHPIAASGTHDDGSAALVAALKASEHVTLRLIDDARLVLTREACRVQLLGCATPSVVVLESMRECDGPTRQRLLERAAVVVHGGSWSDAACTFEHRLHRFPDALVHEASASGKTGDLLAFAGGRTGGTPWMVFERGAPRAGTLVVPYRDVLEEA